jgi:hypothetical protein
MKRQEQPWLIIGIIDAYGAIHHQPIYHGRPNQSQCHEHYWPDAHHKRWRFIMRDWDLSISVLSKDTITPEEAQDIEAHIRKRYTPPNWFLKGEEWEALGRPREGKAYEKFEKKWAKIMKNRDGY